MARRVWGLRETAVPLNGSVSVVTPEGTEAKTCRRHSWSRPLGRESL
jgi:hypothetical protein